MVTLVLGAIGTLVGGPLGGAIGATLGRNLDREIIGNRRREGPRLTELAVSTSSYGQPIPGLYGRVRFAFIVAMPINRPIRYWSPNWAHAARPFVAAPMSCSKISHWRISAIVSRR